jgi:hypothetical protein
MSALREKDLEAGDFNKEDLKPVSSEPPNGEYDGAVPGESFEAGNSLYAKVMRFAGKYGVEQRGIERVPEDERTDNKRPLLNVATMVSSSSCTDAKTLPVDSGSRQTWSSRPSPSACSARASSSWA